MATGKKDSVDKTPSPDTETMTGVDSDGTQHFDGSVHKVDADGNQVMSDYVGPGEELYTGEANHPDNDDKDDDEGGDPRRKTTTK